MQVLGPIAVGLLACSLGFATGLEPWSSRMTFPADREDDDGWLSNAFSGGRGAQGVMASMLLLGVVLFAYPIWMIAILGGVSIGWVIGVLVRAQKEDL